MDNGPLILGFEASIADLARSLQQLEGNMARLSELNGHFVSFNNSFGQMLQGLQLASSCYDYGELPRRLQLATAPAPPPPAPRDVAPPPAPSSAQQQENVAAPAPSKPAPRQGAPGARGKENATRGTRKPLFNAGKIMSQCPNKYQSPPHRQNIEILLRLLHDNPQGLYQNDVIDNCNISRNHTIEYLNMLLRIGELVRESRKGFVYKLHPKHQDPVPSTRPVR